MKTQNNFQKGLSPLIATILLVAVALSLAGILYSWSSQNAKETTEQKVQTQNFVLTAYYSILNFFNPTNL